LHLFNSESAANRSHSAYASGRLACPYSIGVASKMLLAVLDSTTSSWTARPRNIQGTTTGLKMYEALARAFQKERVTAGVG
jgi:hypothetical protein